MSQKWRNAHVFGWGFLALYHTLDHAVSGDLNSHGIALLITYLLAHFICFYFFFALIWHRTIPTKKWIFLGSALVIGSFLFVGSRLLLEEVIVRNLLGRGNYRFPFQWGYVVDNIYRPTPTILISFIAWLLPRQEQMREKADRLEVEKSKAELAFLRGQVNPHFLFNTLGFIHSRVYPLDEELAEMTEELSSVLRKALTSSESEWTTIEEELKIVHALHGIMRKRFPEKCFLALEVEPDSLQERIEPLILMALIENMFKHGDLRSEKDPGQLQIRLEDGKLKVFARNKVMQGIAPEGNGIGLINTRKRLDLVYRDRHQFEILKEDGYFTVKLTLQSL